MEQPAEREWVRRARAGDRAAFAALVERYWDRIRRWLFALTHHAQVAEDLTQDAFVKAWTGLPALQEDNSFRPWLFRIAKNLALDSRKGPRSAPTEPLSQEVAGREPEPLAIMLEQEGQHLLQAACARLPVTYRAAYLLWTQEELPYSEIAQVLGITEETARWRVCRARQFLLKELEPLLDTPKP